MKRFYQRVSIGSGGDGHRILLDGRPVRTPARQTLLAPNPELARSIAAEWQGQGETLQADAMPLTRMASTAIDRMPEVRQAAIDDMVAYVDTDLLCYRAAEPFELVRRQQHSWQPLVEWLARTYGAKLTVTTALVPVAQPETTRARLRAAVEALDDWALVGLHAATGALGSLVLGLALLRRRIDAEAALAASLLDERFEIERWGSDVEIERRHARLRRDVEAADGFLRNLAAASPPA